MIEIWGGIECTINRINNTYFDQLEYNGHYSRTNDIPAFKKLGISFLRYPILWEKHQPNKAGEIDWRWAEDRLQQLRENNIEPIAGLVHHGSGPVFTNLLQDDFPELLAAYAGKVAARFPFLKYYTPVNEPLTTARFSGLYGHWYPHKNNDVSFIKILLNELKGVVLSMKEIRKVNPAAKLVQTEDLGKTYSTDLLEYQSRFENHRRWLTYDILCGNFREDHPLWSYFHRLGIPQSSLNFFLENPCPPDTIGVNYYITSERYLDEDLAKYPHWSYAGNSIHNYADVEMVRVQPEQPVGLEVLLKEMWDRYGIEVAITEVHLHCSRDEQLRWFKEVFDIAKRLSETGIKIKAVTAWALLGSFGWSKLLTEMPGEYEAGVFDVSMGELRETAIAGLIKALNQEKESHSNLLHQQGWWHRSNRFYVNTNKKQSMKFSVKQPQPILVIGKNGTLGRAFANVCEHRYISFKTPGRKELDITDSSSIEKAIELYNPWAIINAAGYVKVDEAENDRTNCFLGNTVGAIELAYKCELHGIKFVTFSSDFVFNGKKHSPYIESDLTDPLNIYGESKALAEKHVLAINPSALVIRTSAFFGPWDRYNFIHHALTQIEKGQPFMAADDITISPTYVPHLVHAALDLLIDDEKDIWHLANKDSITWYNLAREAAQRAGLDDKMIIPVKNEQLKAKRPAYSALASSKGDLMPSLYKGLESYFNELKTLVYNVDT